MKKNISISKIVLCGLLLSLLVSCAIMEEQSFPTAHFSASMSDQQSFGNTKEPDPDKEYVVYNVGDYQCLSGANQVCELSKAEQDLYFDRDDVYEEEIAKNLTVTLDGEEYVCQYYKTYRKGISDDWHAFYEYRCDGIDFYIDPQSGAIIGFLRPGLKADGDRLSMAECRANAYAYASKKIEDFDNALDQLFAQFGDSIAKLQKLAEEYLNYPVNAMTRICKKLSMPKKAAVEAISMYEMAYGGGPATAHDVFMALQEIPFILKTDGFPEGKLLIIEENLARTLSMKWSDFDLAKAVSY